MSYNKTLLNSIHKPLIKAQGGGSMIEGRPTVKQISQMPNKNYEPSDAVKNTKAGLAAASMVAGPFSFLPGIASATYDVGTAAKYAMDGQWGNAGHDLMQAGVSLIPTAGVMGALSGMVGLSKANKAMRGIRAMKAASDLKDMGEAATITDRLSGRVQEFNKAGKETFMRRPRSAQEVKNYNQNLYGQYRTGSTAEAPEYLRPYETPEFAPGGIITDPRGQWVYPGQNTRIPGSSITMQGVNYPVLGVSSDGGQQMMYPGQNYEFGGADYVDEYPVMGSGGYTVTRSHDRKGKTHKVTGPDGTVKYFGDSKLGQHPKDPERKKAFYARHKKNLKNNPYFRAFAKKTWQEGGETDSTLENIAEVFDPTGISSWDDVYRSYKDPNAKWYNTAVEVLGALPLLGKAGKAVKAAGYLGKGLNGYVYAKKAAAAAKALQTAALAGRASDVVQAGAQAPGNRFFPFENGGQMIKRADGSYSKRGLWDNIRANKGSGKKPTKEMLAQEKKINRDNKEFGGTMINDTDMTMQYKQGGTANAGFDALPEYVQAKILSQMGYGGYHNPYMEEGGEPDNDDQQMVSGVANILSMVKNKKNRAAIAEKMVQDFDRENVTYDLKKFTSAANVPMMKKGGSTFSGNAWYKNGGMPCYECGGMYADGGYYDCPDQEKDPETGKCKAEVVRGREANAANKAASADMNAWAKQVAAMDKENARQDAAQYAGQRSFDYDWMQSPVDKAEKKASMAQYKQFFQQNPSTFVPDDTSGFSPEQKYIIASKLKQKASTPMGAKAFQQKFNQDPRFFDMGRIQSDIVPTMGGWGATQNWLFNNKANGGEVMDVTPEYAEQLRQQGYQFEILD